MKKNKTKRFRSLVICYRYTETNCQHNSSRKGEDRPPTLPPGCAADQMQGDKFTSRSPVVPDTFTLGLPFVEWCFTLGMSPTLWLKESRFRNVAIFASILSKFLINMKATCGAHDETFSARRSISGAPRHRVIKKWRHQKQCKKGDGSIRYWKCL